MPLTRLRPARLQKREPYASAKYEENWFSKNCISDMKQTFCFLATSDLLGGCFFGAILQLEFRDPRKLYCLSGPVGGFPWSSGEVNKWGSKGD